MADTETTAAPEPVQNTTIVGKLTIKHLGDPQKFMALLPEKEQEGSVGIIMGRVTAVKRAPNPDKMSFHHYLTGDFEAIPSDKKRDRVRSSKCILADALQDPIIQLFDVLDETTGETITEATSAEHVSSIEFGYEVRLMRANNAQKYSYKFRPLIEAKAADPLAALRQQVIGGPSEQPQIAAPESARPQAPESAETEPAKNKKK